MHCIILFATCGFVWGTIRVLKLQKLFKILKECKLLTD